MAEIGTKAKSVSRREKDKGKASNAPAKMEKEETMAEESEMETSNKTAGLQDLTRGEPLINYATGYQETYPLYANRPWNYQDPREVPRTLRMGHKGRWICACMFRP